MTVQELQARLFELDIPHYYYNICGTGEDEEQRICLVNESGKWLVYYSEDGERLEVSEYLDEAEACADCLNRLAE
ncbi:MAG: hypothetical protein J6A19_15365 [Oscillospiraceae bacterium]|nr:hypothetical protein [Oscillospiraceae bacterium]